MFLLLVIDLSLSLILNLANMNFVAFIKDLAGLHKFCVYLVTAQNNMCNFMNDWGFSLEVLRYFHAGAFHLDFAFQQIMANEAIDIKR